MDVAELERVQLRTAGLLTGEQLRSLDALRWQGDAMLSYDVRQAQAAQDAGIRVLAPR